MRVFLSGGLGNQLFQVSAARYFSHTQATDLRLDQTWTKVSRHPNNTELHRYLNLLPNEKFVGARPFVVGAVELVLSEKLTENNWGLGSGFFPYKHSNSVLDTVHPKHIRAISGSFAQHHAHLVLASFDKSVSLKLPITEHLSLPDRYVAIHLRGGDYFALGDSFGVLGRDYYKEALELVDRDIPLIWVTNDAAHANEIVGHFTHRDNRILSSESLDPFTTLAVISGGDSLIAANSTFSWWGAEISSSIRLKIAPAQYSPKSVGNWMIHGDWISVPSAWS